MVQIDEYAELLQEIKDKLEELSVVEEEDVKPATSQSRQRPDMSVVVRDIQAALCASQGITPLGPQVKKPQKVKFKSNQ